MPALHLWLPFLGIVGLAGCAEEMPTGPRANAAPIAEFTVTCAGLTCTLTDASTDADGTIQAHAYEFGDGGTSAEQSPVHVYADPGGQFTMRLTVTDDRGLTGMTTRDVTVDPTPPAPPSNAAPVADFEVACFALTCVFTDRSTDPDPGDSLTPHSWDFGDGQTLVSDQTPIHEYGDPGGQFIVTLRVTDSHGASSDLSKTVSVSPAGPSNRSGTYERESPHGSPDRHSRYVLFDDGRFEMHDRTGMDSVIHAGSWRPLTAWGGWPIEPNLAVAFDFDDLLGNSFCGEAYGTFFEVSGATHLAIALCRSTVDAGFEEGFYVGPSGSGNPGNPPPQGGQLAVVRNGQIYLVNADGSGPVPLSAGPDDRDPAWSPDGSRLAFTRGGAGGISVMDADGTNVVQRTVAGRAPAWSPDGVSLVFECSDNGQGALCTVEVDDPAAPVLIVQTTVGGQVYAPTWSPDGARIAHTSDRGLYDFWFDIWVVGPDGSGLTALITHTPAMANPYEFYQPAWSPDGQHLALVTCSWGWRVCSSSVVSVMRADGSDLEWLAVATSFDNPTRAPDGQVIFANPTWSPDGQIIAFSSANVIEWVSADGLQRGRIAEDAHSPAWRP